MQTLAEGVLSNQVTLFEVVDIAGFRGAGVEANLLYPPMG
jgi:hypothetical protein